MTALTLLVPTNASRQVYSYALLQFLVKYAPDWDILLCDWGDEPLDVAAYQAAFPILRLGHHHFGAEILPHDRWSRMGPLVETPYVLICPDDDWVFPDAVTDGLAFLEEHPDYVACQGRALRLHETTGKVSSYQMAGFDDPDPLKRLTLLSRGFVHHIYGLHRREAFLGRYGFIKNIGHETLFCEYLDSMVNVLQGKTHCMDRLFALRRYQSANGGVVLAKTDYHLRNLVFTADFSRHNLKFLDLLREFMQSVTDETPERLEKILREAWRFLMLWALYGQRARTKADKAYFALMDACLKKKQSEEACRPLAPEILAVRRAALAMQRAIQAKVEKRSPE